MPQSYREQCGSGVFLVRAGSDVQAVAKSVTRLLPDIASTAFTFLAAIPLMVKISPGITGIVLAVVPMNYLITAHLTGRAVRLSLTACTVAEKIATFTQETIEGVTLCRIFSLDRMRRRELAHLATRAIGCCVQPVADEYDVGPTCRPDQYVVGYNASVWRVVPGARVIACNWGRPWPSACTSAY